MKQSCRDLEPLLTPYVDGEATADQCAAVEAHLTACPTCRDCADALAHVRQLLQDCRAELQGHAPQELRDRIARLARTVEPDQSSDATARPPFEPLAAAGGAPDSAGAAAARAAVEPRAADWRRGAWRRWATPLSVAATLALAIVGILVYGLIGPRGTAFASQLAEDHVRCTRQFGGQAGADATVQAAAWARARGWSVTLPPSSSADDMQFVLVRRCVSADGSVAHALYRHRGRMVSLYIAQQGGRRPETLEVLGQQTCIWNHEDRSYAVIADQSPEEMARLVAWFRRRIGG